MTQPFFNASQRDPEGAPLMVLAHGAGVGAESPFMEALARCLAVRGISVQRFEFPYMQRRREDGRKRPPDREPVLLDHYARVVRQCREQIGRQRRLVIGGKSMGGRIASLLAASPEGPDVEAVACFGYPFHPPGKLERWRTGHFPQIDVPVAIFQGTRDPFGKPLELEAQPSLPAGFALHWLEGGNHDLRPLKKQGLDADALIEQAADLAADFVHTLA